MSSQSDCCRFVEAMPMCFGRELQHGDWHLPMWKEWVRTITGRSVYGHYKEYGTYLDLIVND